MYLINIVRGVYEALIQPIDLDVPRDQVSYTVLSRAIAATFGTATILVTYAIAARIGGRLAGLLVGIFRRLRCVSISAIRISPPPTCRWSSSAW